MEIKLESSLPVMRIYNYANLGSTRWTKGDKIYSNQFKILESYLDRKYSLTIQLILIKLSNGQMWCGAGAH